MDVLSVSPTPQLHSRSTRLRAVITASPPESPDIAQVLLTETSVTIVTIAERTGDTEEARGTPTTEIAATILAITGTTETPVTLATREVIATRETAAAEATMTEETMDTTADDHFAILQILFSISSHWIPRCPPAHARGVTFDCSCMALGP